MEGSRHSSRARWWQWWPPLAILAIVAILWRQFPVPVAPRAIPRPPEPSVEYVVLAPGFQAMRPDEFAHRSGFGSSGATEDFATDFGMLVPRLADPVFLRRPPDPEPGDPIGGGAAASIPAVASQAAPGSILPPPEQVWHPTPAHYTRLWFNVSPSLAAADFTLTPPTMLSFTQSIARVRFFVEIAEDGSVAHVLLDAKPASSDADGFIDAMLSTLGHARASTNASGFVDAGVTIPPQDARKE